MMADFTYAINTILEHEGGYVNHPNDPGGETNFGITKRTYPDLDIKGLTRRDAIKIYFNDWWLRYRFCEIKYTVSATKVFDVSINMGARRGVKIAQKAVNALGYASLKVDGVIGGRTVHGINLCPERAFVNKMAELQLERYERLIRHNPKLAVFRTGWTRRAKWGSSGQETGAR